MREGAKFDLLDSFAFFHRPQSVMYIVPVCVIELSSFFNSCNPVMCQVHCLFSHLARLFQSVFVLEIVSPIVATSLQLQLVQTSVKLVPPWSSISFETCSTLRLKVETKEKRREKERREEKAKSLKPQGSTVFHLP